MARARVKAAQLPGWQKYCDEMRASSSGRLQDGAPARFHSRWRLARSFKGLLLDGYADERTRKGNNVLFRLSIAYSVVDQLWAVDPQLGGALRSLPDRRVADDIRTHLCMDAIVNNEKVSTMKARGEFDSVTTTDDVMLFARAIRHIVAHGSATPWGLGVTTKAARNAVDQLSEVILSGVEDAFLQFVQRTWPSAP
jgi:hypothetical protein